MSATTTTNTTLAEPENKVLEVVSSSSELITVQSSTTTVETSSTLVADTSSITEHEEGEIDDDDEEDQEVLGGVPDVVLEYEDISSEEEFTIRERIAQLEAMDTQLGLLSSVVTSGKTAKKSHYAHDKPPLMNIGKENYECISDEEDIELYLQRYEPVPKPKLLPGRRKLRPIKSTPQKLVPSARRREESKRRLVKRRHEQSAPRKSAIHRRHKRRKQHPSCSIVSIGDTSESDVDFPLDRARLQAACNISGGKRKTDKENWDALKQKLKLSLQKRRKVQVPSKDVEIILDEPMVLVDEDEEDEEVLQLRLQALKTKAEVKDSEVISLLEDPPSPGKIAEEQELRMIALHSAFTKKHQIRLKKRQEERPYSPSDEIPLLSPVRECPPSIGEIVDEDDDVQIIETRAEMVEIADSSSEDETRMVISPSASPQCPEPPDIRPVDMELATSGESCSPVPTAIIHNQHPPKENSPELEAPPPPIISLQNKLPEEDDEETLRNQLLSKLSAAVLRPAPTMVVESRPMTPDSMGEEEAEALRELIISKMKNKKISKKQEKAETPPQASEISYQTDINHIPQSLPNPSSVMPCLTEPLSISINDTLPVGPTPPKKSAPSPALSAIASNNVAAQLRVQSNPNLITLIGKQKVARKKRKKSLVSSQAKAENKTIATPMAIASPLPIRTLIKAPLTQLPPKPAPVTHKPTVTTTKLVNNPNKLINLNAPMLHSPKQRSALLESYVQKPVPRLVIQVGYSDSDSDPDYYPAPDLLPEPELERLSETLLRDLDNASPSRVMLESPTYSPAPPVGADMDNDSIAEPLATSASGNITEVAFEQRLDQFLKTVRNKIDQGQSGVGGESVGVRRTVVAPSAGNGSTGLGTTEKAARKPITAPTPITPSAVRHLPKSAQLEYKRLVARMAQLEKQKQQRVPVQNQRVAKNPPPLTKTIINTGPADAGAGKNHELIVTINRDRRDVVDKSSTAHTLMQARNHAPTASTALKRDSDTLVKRVLINNTVIAEGKNNTQVVDPTVDGQSMPCEETKDEPVKASTNPSSTQTKHKTPVKLTSSPRRKDSAVETDQEISTLREALRRLPSIKEEDRPRVLTIAEHRFEKHSQRFARELQDLIVTVENAQLERQKQYDLENKVAFLKEKLMILERASAMQKKRMAEIFPALHQRHTKVMNSRKRSIELNNLCLSIGREIRGDSYDPPSCARNEIHEQLKVLTNETKQLKHMKKLSLDEFKQVTAEQRRQLVEKQRERQRQPLESPELVNSAEPAKFPEPTKSPEPAHGHDPGTSPASPDLTSTHQSDELPIEAEQTESKAPEEPPGEAEMFEVKQYAKSAPASRCTSPLVATVEQEIQEAPAAFACEPQSWFGKYMSPLASLQDQSALNIPDGVICPYQMRGECVDQDCKFVHFQ